jgi:hypothetical protein
MRFMAVLFLALCLSFIWAEPAEARFVRRVISRILFGRVHWDRAAMGYGSSSGCGPTVNRPDAPACRGDYCPVP